MMASEQPEDNTSEQYIRTALFKLRWENRKRPSYQRLVDMVSKCHSKLADNLQMIKQSFVVTGIAGDNVSDLFYIKIYSLISNFLLYKKILHLSDTVRRIILDDEIWEEDQEFLNKVRKQWQYHSCQCRRNSLIGHWQWSETGTIKRNIDKHDNRRDQSKSIIEQPLISCESIDGQLLQL